MIKILNILPAITTLTGVAAISAVNIDKNDNEEEQQQKAKVSDTSVINPLDAMAKSPETLSAQAQVLSQSSKETKILGPENFDSYDKYCEYIMKNESLDFSEKMEKLREGNSNDFRIFNIHTNDLLLPDETPLSEQEKEAFSKIIKHPDLNYIFHNAKPSYSDDIVRSFANFITDMQSEYDLLEDDVVKDFVDTKLAKARKCKNKSEKDRLVTEAANALNAYHQLKGNLSGYIDADLIDAAPIYIYTQHVELLQTFESDFPEKVSKFRDYIENPEISETHSYFGHDFLDAQKTSAMQKIRDKKLLNYLYTNYYVENLDKPLEIKKMLNKINKQTGCKIILSSYSRNDLAELKLVYRELSDWKKLSNGEARLPRIINFSLAKNRFLDGNCCGYTTPDGVLSLRGQKESNIREALRHELIHIMDTTKIFDDFKTTELVNSIMPAKTIIINGRKQKVLDFENCKYREELLKAGIDPGHIRYAYTNRAEFIAVAGEGDCSKYSDEFKEVLIKLGMPWYALNMPCINTDFKVGVIAAEKVFSRYKDGELPPYEVLVELIEAQKDSVYDFAKILQAMIFK